MEELVLDGESLVTPAMMAAEMSGLRGSKDSYSSDGAARSRFRTALENAGQRFEQGWSVRAVARWAVSELDEVRRMATPAEWRELAEEARSHPLSKRFLEDPFTRWSFEKPRGYSGDAHLLDFVYCHPNVAGAVADSSPLGKELCAAIVSFKACAAVRERRDLLTMYVDETADSRGAGAEILAVAAGHLREAACSTALRDGRLKRWIALDQDPLSVASISREYGSTAVTAMEGSVRSLLADGDELGRFDFIYAAGLYDYLSHPVAVKLTRRCLAMLKPGGRFLFANFSEETDGAAYMESFMRWTLLLRSEEDMWGVIRASAGEAEVQAEVFPGENGNVLYGVITKGG